ASIEVSSMASIGSPLWHPLGEPPLGHLYGLHWVTSMGSPLWGHLYGVTYRASIGAPPVRQVAGLRWGRLRGVTEMAVTWPPTCALASALCGRSLFAPGGPPWGVPRWGPRGGVPPLPPRAPPPRPPRAPLGGGGGGHI